MTPEQRERKLATQRECMRRQRERMTPEELQAKRVANRDYMRRLRVEDPERARAAERRYDETHKEQRSYYSFCRHQENPEASNARKAAWRKANPERNRKMNREQLKRARSTPEGRETEARRARRKYIRSVKDEAALGKRIAAAAEAVARTISADLRQEVVGRLVEGAYVGRFPIRLKQQHAAEALREYFRQFSKFDTVSLDEVIGENGFTRGNALGVL